MSVFLTMDEAEAILENCENILEEWRNGQLSTDAALACIQRAVNGESVE